MPYKSWNTFKKANPGAVGFATSITTKFPKGPHFDKAGLELPTPYGLLKEWLKEKLTGDWTARTQSKNNRSFVVVLVSNQNDAAIIGKAFGPVGKAQHVPNYGMLHEFGFIDRAYVPVARSLGYTP